MESFFRCISYVDYYRNEERVKNVGFLRWKLQNGKHRIELQLKDLDCSQGTYQVKEKNTGKSIGDIVIDKGIGDFKKEFSSISASGEMYLELFGDRLYLSDVKGFLVLLSRDEYLSVSVKLDVVKKEERFTESTMISDVLPDSFMKSNTIWQNTSHDNWQKTKEAGNIQDAKAASENVFIEGIEEKYIEPMYVKRIGNDKVTNNVENSRQLTVKKEIESEKKKENPGREEQLSFENESNAEKECRIDKRIKIIEPIHDDKWQQLCKKYPNVHPFPNDRLFLSIKPEDFIILQKEYQKLVHNSFLLHGFYNYGHMILGKLSEEEKTPIYIGVPGVYYDQEKRAAQMFGFVGFESVEHPVQSGSYGYYMIEVEI